MDLSISNNTILAIIVAIDLFILVVFAFFTCLQSMSESSDVEIFKDKSSNLSDFSLEIKGFKFGDN